MKSKTSLFRGWAFIGLLLSTSCESTMHSNYHGLTLRDYARKARERGSREALVPYAFDEEEGEMLIIRNLDEAINSYQWVVGEPIEEQTLTVATSKRSPSADSIYTVYRIRVEKRLGKSKYQIPADSIEEKALRDTLCANIDETESAAIITEQGGQENHRGRNQGCSSFCDQLA